MLLSIITITRNDTEGLEATLCSLAAQEGARFEYLIVNGGSVEGVATLARRYGDLITAVLRRTPAGISDAFNYGVAHATGEVVLFLNSGDTLSTKSALRDALSEISKFSDRGNRIFCGRYRYCGNGMSLLMVPKPENLAAHCSIGHQAAFTGINVLRQFPFDERVRTAMDYDFWLRCRMSSVPFVVLSALVADFGEGGVSSGTERAVYNEMSKEVCKFLGVYNDYHWRDLARFFLRASLTALRLRCRAALGTQVTRWYRRLRYPN